MAGNRPGTVWERGTTGKGERSVAFHTLSIVTADVTPCTAGTAVLLQYQH
jgi:hypothetical protein